MKGWKSFVIIIFLVLTIVFILQNPGMLEVKFLAWKFGLPWVQLFAAILGVGCIIGFLLGWELFSRKPKLRKKDAEAKAASKTNGQGFPRV